MRLIGSEAEGQEGCVLELSWSNFVVKQQVLQEDSGSGKNPVCQCLDSHCCSSEFWRNFSCIYSHLKATKQLIILGEAGIK